jgi:ABC-type molybdate transport system substrate-binding protein
VPGTDFVGALPSEIQYLSVFSIAVVKDGKQPEACKRLIGFFRSQTAAEAIRKSGMEPLTSR